MMAYAERAGLESDVERAFVRIIRRLDVLQRERHDRSNKTTSAGDHIPPSGTSVDVDTGESIARPTAVRRRRGT